MKSGFVSFVGRSNAGKSTLLNRIIGSKLAIVSDKPQTTRNRILGVKNYPDAQVVFLDTPGIHRPLHRMNVRMVDAALETMRSVDVLALVVDAAERTGKGDQYVLDLVRGVKVPVFLILNKIDLVKKTIPNKPIRTVNLRQPSSLKCIAISMTSLITNRRNARPPNKMPDTAR